MCRPNHSVILGEHDRSSKAEDIQTIKIDKVKKQQASCTLLTRMKSFLVGL